ncbi:hemin receptor [Bacteroidia bacterium]|nr:hemin receptor [Bacteroidia bacterium]
MKKYIFILVALFVSVHSFGQGEIDAYRLSKNDLSGTARGQAMGGAFGALGGDVTGVAINPAGIGIYRSSEVIFNAGLTFNQSKSTLDGFEETMGTTKFSCDNFAYIGYFPLGKDDNYSLNFGFNYNRLKSFDRKYKVSGIGMGSSLTDYMAYMAEETPVSWWDNHSDIDEQFTAPNHPHWLGILGYNGYLINPTSTNGVYESFLNQGETVDPTLEVHERGSIGAYDFTLGANLNNKLYVGTTITYTDISYVAGISYDERFAGGGGFNLANDYNTEGSGIQLKLGLIFKPIDALRLGVSYHSPTWYTLTDYYRGVLAPDGIMDGNGRPVDAVSTPAGAYYEYHFSTPDVWTFSAAAVLGQIAVVSVDYEYKNYSRMKFSKQYANDYDFEPENGWIKEDFKGASTIRAGAEIRFMPQLSGRLGAAWMQNPFQSAFKNSETQVMTPGTIPNYTIDGDVLYLTTGIGYRFTPQFYMDLALVYKTQNDESHPYSPIVYKDGGISAPVPAKLANNSFKTLVTLGYKF